MTYRKIATTFLKDNNVTMKVREIGFDYPDWDIENEHCEFKITFYRGSSTRGNKDKFSLNFWQSIAEGNHKPTAYDVLACITKNDPGTFEDFCSEFGYSTDSKQAYKTYYKVMEEWNKVKDFFSLEEIEELQEIN